MEEAGLTILQVGHRCYGSKYFESLVNERSGDEVTKPGVLQSK